jgi:hypothetical protein
VSRSEPSLARRATSWIVASWLLATASIATAHHVTAYSYWSSYAPGQRVLVISHGWLANEKVLVTIADERSRRPARAFRHVATEHGNIHNEAFVTPHDAMRETFRVTVRGIESRREVETTFEVSCPRGFVPDENCRKLGMAECEVGCGRTFALGDCHPTASVPAGAGRICRWSVNACDDNEVCDGVSTTCPPLEITVSDAECDLGRTTLLEVVDDCTGPSEGCPTQDLAAIEPQRRSRHDVVYDAIEEAAPRHSDRGARDVADGCDSSLAPCPGEASEPIAVVPTPAPSGCDTLACDDGWACTRDACDPTAGCRSEPDHGLCNDGNVCTLGMCDPRRATGGRPSGCAYTLHPTAGCEASITDPWLCPLDVDALTNAQAGLKLIFTPAPERPGSFELSASNPAYLRYNTMYVGPGDETVEIVVPFPLVTAGDESVRVYDSVIPDLSGCFVPGGEIASASTGVSLRDYDPPRIGSTATLAVDLPSLPGHFAYLTLRLDYGLYKSTSFAKSSENAATDALTGTWIVPDDVSYEIRDSTGGSSRVRSTNTFKQSPGIAGLVTDAIGTPLGGVKVEIYGPGRALLRTVFTDTDGWYRRRQRHEDDPVVYTIVLPDAVPARERTVTLAASDLAVVSFSLP